MKKHILILALLMLIALVAMPATAETLTGTLGGTVISSDSYNIVFAAAGALGRYDTLIVYDIEQTAGSSAFVNFVLPVWATGKNSGTAPFTAKIGGVQIGNGTIGFQRLYSSVFPFTETTGYIYLLFDNWTVTSHSGDQIVSITYDNLVLGNSATYANIGSPPVPDSGRMAWKAPGGPNIGSFILNKNQPTFNTYTVTKPAGLGIFGTVTKSVGGIVYPSKIFITDALGGYISGEAVINPTDYTINVVNDSISIRMLSTSGVWYNSSNLFLTTPTTGGTSVATWFAAIDGLTSGTIHGSDIQIHDEGNSGPSSWVNTTADADGASHIIVNTSTTLAGYAQATGYTSISRTGLTPIDGLYELIMWPTSQQNTTVPWNVNLYVIVNDAVTYQPLQGVQVQAAVPSGATQAATTNAAGTVTFQIANKTFIRLTASLPGYWTGTTSITTTDWGPDTKRIELQKATVAPLITATPLPGEVTARPTIMAGCEDPDSSSCSYAKDRKMMNDIRDWSNILIPVACLMTLLYMMGWKP